MKSWRKCNRHWSSWCIAIAAFACLSVSAQQNNPRPITDKDVVKMAKAGVSEDNILQAIHPPCDFDLSPDALIELKAEGVSDRTVGAMQNCHGGANKVAAANAMYAIKRSPLHGVAVESRMVTLTELKERYPGVLKNDEEASKAGGWRYWQFGGTRVVISNIAKDSTAAKAGLRPGDLVTMIVLPGRNEYESVVSSGDDFLRLSSECEPDCLIYVYHQGSYAGGGPILVGPQKHFQLKQDSMYPASTCFEYFDPQSRMTWWGADLGETQSRICSRAVDAHVRRLQNFQVTAITPPQQQVPASNTQAVLPTHEIQQEIQRIRNAPHEAMPPAQSAGASLGGQTSMTVENGTSYLLHIYLSGPASQKLEIVAGGSQTLDLPPGHYEVAARISNNAVTPFYGTEDYAPNTQYSSHFYIATRPR
jgi:hypothetical protein